MGGEGAAEGRHAGLRAEAVARVCKSDKRREGYDGMGLRPDIGENTWWIWTCR